MGFYGKDELVLQRLNLNPVYVKANGVAGSGVWVQAHLCFIIWLGAYVFFEDCLHFCYKPVSQEVYNSAIKIFALS